MAAAALVGAILGSCTGTGRVEEGQKMQDGPPAAETVRWPYWPTRIRFHPLTRLATDGRSGSAVIEARLELYDGDDYTSRGYGQVQIDLLDPEKEAGKEPIQRWYVDLRDLGTNRQRYDPVTRTYLLPLELKPNAVLPEELELWVYFLSADGLSLEEESIRIRCR